MKSSEKERGSRIFFAKNRGKNFLGRPKAEKWPFLGSQGYYLWELAILGQNGLPPPRAPETGQPSENVDIFLRKDDRQGGRRGQYASFLLILS